METATLRLKNVYKYYVSGRNVTVGLDGVSLTLSTGEFVAVTGESGSGKSTLAHVMAGILPWESGEMYLNDSPTSQYDETDWESYRRDNISFIAQNYGILPGNTVLENVVSALILLGMEKREAKAEAERLLRMVDLWSMRRRRAGRLSSGQKQRLSIARALAKPAPILIADEPTGNLDKENSQKIIDLLAEASRERLVIMITHDFEVSKAAITREISIHDGAIESDKVIIPGCAEEKAAELKGNTPADGGTVTGETAASVHKQTDAGLGWYIAGLMFRARPAWTCFMVLFFSLMTFAVFAFLGTVVANLDDTHTKIFEYDTFLNGDDRRLAVIRSDREALTQEDFEKLLSVDYVVSLEKYGLMQDVNYYYRENVDYKNYYWTEGDPMAGSLTQKSAPMFLNESMYIRTVPLLREDEAFLKAGTLPEHMNEVVAVGDESLLGTTIRLLIRNRKSWSEDEYIELQVTVVGVTDFGEGLYVEDRIAKALYPSVEGKWTDPVYGVNENLADNQVTITQKRVNQYIGQGLGVPKLQYVMNYNTGAETILEYAEINNCTLLNYREVSEATFDCLAMQIPSTQAAVFIEDYSYTDRVIEDIQQMGYKVVSPYRLCSVKVDEQKANERLTTLVLCVLALVVAIGAQTAVLSAMFGLEMGNLKQVSDLGLSFRSGRFALLWQVLVLTAVGQALGFGCIWLGAENGIERLVNITKYLTPLHIALFSLVHLAAMAPVVLVTWVVLRRQVFPLLRDSERVDLAELGEEDD